MLWNDWKKLEIKQIYEYFVVVDVLKLFPQMVQPIMNPNHLCNMHSLFNKKCLFLFKSSKQFTSVISSHKDQNNGYPKW